MEWSNSRRCPHIRRTTTTGQTKHGIYCTEGYKTWQGSLTLRYCCRNAHSMWFQYWRQNYSTSKCCYSWEVYSSDRNYSYIINYYKREGDAAERENYREQKLLNQVLKEFLFQSLWSNRHQLHSVWLHARSWHYR